MRENGDERVSLIINEKIATRNSEGQTEKFDVVDDDVNVEYSVKKIFFTSDLESRGRLRARTRCIIEMREGQRQIPVNETKKNCLS